MTPRHISARFAASTMVAGLAAALLPALSLAPAQAAPVARPTEDIYQAPEATPVCVGGSCVHYAQDGTNDVPTEDDGAGGAWAGTAENGVPDYVDLMSGEILPEAADVFAEAGYDAPMADGTAGGGSQVDFYLAELEDVAGGAYCVPEQPATIAATAGFCVLDNDYSAAEYGARLTPAQNLGLDVLHQYAYLVQWAYGQDSPWVAAVAAWIEDEVYPTLNRNRAYLGDSPLAKPGTSMIDIHSDAEPDDGLGRWIFLRYLSERFPAEVGGLPVVVRDLVENGADAALASRGTTMLKQFTTFTTWNRNPAAFYDEGAAYPTAPLAGNVMLSGVTNTRTFTGQGQQWTSHSFRFRPSSLLSGRWQIRLDARSESILQPSGKAFVATFKAKGKPAATRVIATADAEQLTAGITLSFNTSVEWVELRVVTGEVGIGSNPSETGRPTYKITATVSRR